MKQLLSNLSPKQKAVLFAAVALVLVVVFYFTVLTEQRNYINQLNNEAELQKQRLRIIEKFVLEHPDSDRYMAELDQKITAADQLLPDQPDIGGFLAQLDQTAAASGVKLNQIKPGQALNKAGYREFPIEIIIRGSYADTMTFLTNLESIPRFNSVKNIATQSRQAILESKLSVVIYSYGAVQNQNSNEPTPQ